MSNKIVKNASWIIVCRIIQAGLNLAVTMLSARFLGPAGYGIINYAASLVAFFVPLMQLGLNSVMVQEVVNHPDKEGETLGTAVGLSFFSSFLTIGGILAFTAVANFGETDTLIICGLYSILLIFHSIDVIQYWFQAKLLSKYTSIIMLVAFSVVAVYRILLLATGQSIYWFAISQAIDYLIIAVLLLIVYKKVGTQKLKFSWERAKQLFQKSKYFILSNMMLVIFAQTDKIMLKIMLGDAETGFYSAAVTCAGMTSFVFAAIIDSCRASIFEAKKKGEEGYERNVKRLYAIIVYLALAQSVFICLLASPIVRILYGESYGATVPMLQVIVWYTAFSYLGSVANIWMLAENRQSLLWILNLGGAVLNIGLNVLLIPIWGGVGAAVASLATQVFTNLILRFAIPKTRGSIKLLWQSLNPKILLELVKKKKKQEAQENVEQKQENE